MPRWPRRSQAVGLFRVAVLLLFLSLVVWAGARVAQAATEGQPLRGAVHVVQAGETLWSIVSVHYGTQRYDVRRLVYVVAQENHLTTARLLPGQELRLPPLQ